MTTGSTSTAASGATGALGVVLKTTPLRESDVLVTLYTDLHGKIAAVARGARRSKVRFAGALSLLVLGRFQLGQRPRGDLWALESADVVREWTALSHDVVAVAHASYAVELVGALVAPEEPDAEVLALVVDLWDSLAASGPSGSVLRAVELMLLELGGHRPSLDRCAACGERDLETGCVFDPVRGGAVCRRCAATSRGPAVRPIDPAARDYLRAIAACTAPSAAVVFDRDPRFSAADRFAAREAMIAMVLALIGRPLRSLEYLRKLAAARPPPPTTPVGE